MIKVILKRYKWVIIAITISALLFAWVIIAYISKFYGDLSNDQTVFGLFGDYVGGTLGSIFAFASFMALLYTIHLQHQDLIATRKEADEQKKLADHQITLMIIQNFETTFFSMLSQIPNIINLYHFDSQSGASYLTNNLKYLWRDYNVYKKLDFNNVDVYLQANPKYLYDFRNFVIHVANIVRLIHNSNFEALRFEMYYDILNGYLSHLQKFYIEVCRNSESFKDIKQYLEFVDRSKKIWVEGCKQEVEEDTAKISRW